MSWPEYVSPKEQAARRQAELCDQERLEREAREARARWLAEHPFTYRLRLAVRVHYVGSAIPCMPGLSDCILRNGLTLEGCTEEEYLAVKAELEEEGLQVVAAFREPTVQAERVA